MLKFTMTITYDPLGRLTSATATWRNGLDIPDEAIRYGYNIAGVQDKAAHANGMAEAIVTDALDRTVSMTHFRDLDDDGVQDVGEATLARFDYTYDLMGNRSTSAETLNNQTRSYAWTYDALNRLASETFSASDLTGYVHTFTYDLASNRTAKVVDSTDNALDESIAYAHDPNDRLKTETSTLAGTTTYGYNQAGDQTNKTTPGTPSNTTSYRFDARGRLVGVDTNNDGLDEVTYTYDAQGRRIAQTANGTTTAYLFDNQNPTGYAKAIEEKVNGNITRSYVIGTRVEAQWDAANGPQQLLHDAHGSTRALLNSLAAVLETYSYSAFGNVLGFDPATARTTWLYANDGVYDPASQLHYHLARWRSGDRFVSMDPFAGFNKNPLSLHKFIYAHQNPIQFIDPSGKSAWSILKLALPALFTNPYLAGGALVLGSAWYLSSKSIKQSLTREINVYVPAAGSSSSANLDKIESLFEQTMMNPLNDKYITDAFSPASPLLSFNFYRGSSTNPLGVQAKGSPTYYAINIDIVFNRNSPNLGDSGRPGIIEFGTSAFNSTFNSYTSLMLARQYTFVNYMKHELFHQISLNLGFWGGFMANFNQIADHNPSSDIMAATPLYSILSSLPSGVNFDSADISRLKGFLNTP